MNGTNGLNGLSPRASKSKVYASDTFENQQSSLNKSYDIHRASSSIGKSAEIVSHRSDDAFGAEKQTLKASRSKTFSASISNLTKELHATADLVHVDHRALSSPRSPQTADSPPSQSAAVPRSSSSSAAAQDRPRGPAPSRSFRGIAQLTQELRDSDGRRDRAVRDLLGAPAAPPPHAPPRGGAASLGGGSGSGTFHGAATPRGAAGASLNRTASLHNSKASAAPASLNLNAVPSAVAGPVLAAAGSFRAARAQPLDSPAAGPPDSPPPRRAPGAGPKTGGGGGGGSLAARASRALLRPMRQCLSVPA